MSGVIWNQEKIDTLLRMRAEHKTIELISDHLNTRQQTVRRYCRKHGIDTGVPKTRKLWAIKTDDNVFIPVPPQPRKAERITSVSALCPRCGITLVCAPPYTCCACGQYVVNKTREINHKIFLVPRRAPNKNAITAAPDHG